MNRLPLKIKLYGAAMVFGISLSIIYTGHISAAPSTNEVKSAIGKDVDEHDHHDSELQ